MKENALKLLKLSSQGIMKALEYTQKGAAKLHELYSKYVHTKILELTK